LARIALAATTWIVAHEVVPFVLVDVREHRASVMKPFRSGFVPKVAFFEIVADVSRVRRSDGGKWAGAETIQESVPLHETPPRLDASPPQKGHQRLVDTPLAHGGA
jgi:hypothetical protein